MGALASSPTACLPRSRTRAHRAPARPTVTRTSKRGSIANPSPLFCLGPVVQSLQVVFSSVFLAAVADCGLSADRSAHWAQFKRER